MLLLVRILGIRETYRRIDFEYIFVYNKGMKKKELEKELKRLGWKLKRQGGSHEIWSNGITVQPLPRHNEIKEH
jgi:mRNA interferase HicA